MNNAAQPLPASPDTVEEYEVRFSPRSRHPVQNVTVQLHTEMTHRLLKAQFNHVQNALFFLDAIYPNSWYGREDVSEAVNEMLFKRMERVDERLAQEVARLRSILKSEGVDTIEEYTVETSHVLPSYSPTMSRWIALVSQADDLMCLVDALWYGAFFSSATRAAFLTKWRNALTGLSREIYSLKRRVANHDPRAREDAGQPIKKASTSGRDSDYAITDEESDDTSATAQSDAQELAPLEFPLSTMDTHLDRHIHIPKANSELNKPPVDKPKPPKKKRPRNNKAKPVAAAEKAKPVAAVKEIPQVEEEKQVEATATADEPVAATA